MKRAEPHAPQRLVARWVVVVLLALVLALAAAVALWRAKPQALPGAAPAAGHATATGAVPAPAPAPVPAPAPAPTTAPTTAAATGARISGRVTLAPGLGAQVKPDDTVFIFARLVDGPRMPVALLQRRAAELPLDFVLDERSAMNPSLRLSASMLVVVGVRVSRSGQAAPQAGDVQGFSQPVTVGTSGLQIQISEAVK